MSKEADFLTLQWIFLKKVAVSFVVFGIVISILLVNALENNNKTMSKEKMDSYVFLYDVVAFLFTFVLLCMIYYYGFSDGSLRALFIWSFFLVATPIPESGLLVTLPFKRFFDMDMPVVQVILSMLCMIFMFSLDRKSYKKYFLGKLFDKILDNKYYLIFVLSIVSSIVGSELIENIIDNYVSGIKVENSGLKKGIFVGLIMIYFVLLWMLFSKK